MGFGLGFGFRFSSGPSSPPSTTGQCAQQLHLLSSSCSSVQPSVYLIVLSLCYGSCCSSLRSTRPTNLLRSIFRGPVAVTVPVLVPRTKQTSNFSAHLPRICPSPPAIPTTTQRRSLAPAVTTYPVLERIRRPLPVPPSQSTTRLA